MIAKNREISKFFEASCSMPIAANAIIHNNKISISSMVGSLDGSKKIYHKENGSLEEYKKISKKVNKDEKERGQRITIICLF